MCHLPESRSRGKPNPESAAASSADHMPGVDSFRWKARGARLRRRAPAVQQFGAVSHVASERYHCCIGPHTHTHTHTHSISGSGKRVDMKAKYHTKPRALGGALNGISSVINKIRLFLSFQFQESLGASCTHPAADCVGAVGTLCYLPALSFMRAPKAWRGPPPQTARSHGLCAATMTMQMQGWQDFEALHAVACQLKASLRGVAPNTPFAFPGKLKRTCGVKKNKSFPPKRENRHWQPLCPHQACSSSPCP